MGSGPTPPSAQSKVVLLFQWQSQFAKIEGSAEARNQQLVGIIGIVSFEN